MKKSNCRERQTKIIVAGIDDEYLIYNRCSYDNGSNRKRSVECNW